MKDICVWLVVISSIIFGFCYVLQIKRKKAAPTISTWIIFLVGCGLSFLTYLAAENRDIKSGIQNTMDLVYITAVLVAIIFWGKGKVKIGRFEKWYLAGAAGIVVYGFLTGDMWHSNALAQVLTVVAYAPMYQKILKEKTKTDSYFGWLPSTFSSVATLYPAVCQGNVLTEIYAIRSFTLSLIMVLLMRHYEIKARKKQALT